MIQLEKKQRILVANESDEYILVKVADIQELMDRLNEQPTWATGMKWLTQQTDGMSAETLRTKILYPYREELEDFISYPESSGQPWRFNIKPMKEWLEKNFRKVER